MNKLLSSFVIGSAVAMVGSPLSALAEQIPMDNPTWGYVLSGLGSKGLDTAYVFTNTAATMSWVAPDGVQSIELLVVGGGGAGGDGFSGNYSWMGCGGGGSGGGGSCGKCPDKGQQTPAECGKAKDSYAGNAGGIGRPSDENKWALNYGAGGGGGGAGGAGQGAVNNEVGGAGGAGKACDITGETVVYAAGGKGADQEPSTGKDATVYGCGGDGSAGNGNFGGKGFQGVVIVRVYEHKWDWNDVVFSTCTEVGHSNAVCTIEGCTATAHLDIAPLGHDFSGLPGDHVCIRKGCEVIAAVFPTLESVVYTGEPQKPDLTDEHFDADYGAETYTDAKTYTIKLTPKANTVWSDTQLAAERNVSYTITQTENDWMSDPSVSPIYWKVTAVPDEITIANGSAAFGTKSKDLRTRTVGQSYQAAFNVRMAKRVLDAGGSYIAAWGFFSGEDPLFAGIPTFDYFTAREIALFAGLGRCGVVIEGTVPEKEAVDAIAASSSDGRMVRVAVSRLRDTLEFADSLEIKVCVILPSSLAATGRISVSELTLDDRNNWFTDWERDRRGKGVKDTDYWASPDDPNPLISLSNGPAIEFFRSRMSAYAAKADKVVPRVVVLPVPQDGILALTVTFCGNGAVFFALHDPVVIR